MSSDETRMSDSEEEREFREVLKKLMRKRKHSSPNREGNRQTPNAPEASTARQTNKFHEILELPLLPNFSEVPEELLNLLSSKALSEAELFQLMKKYNLPENFESIRPKILPSAITSKIGDKVRKFDELQLIAQTKLSSIVGAVLASFVTSNLGLPVMQGQLTDLKEKLRDIAVLAIDLQFTLTSIRRSNIIPAVNPSQRSQIDGLLPISDSKMTYDDIDPCDERVLIYLRNKLDNNIEIPIKDLQLKLLFILQLTSHKNIITLANITISQIFYKDNFAEINIPEEDIKFRLYENIEDPAICPINALKTYIERTSQGRGEVDYLILQNRKKGNQFERSVAPALERTLKDFKYEAVEWVKRNLTDELK